MRRPPSASADDRYEFARVLDVVGGHEFDERMLRRTAAEERDDVLAVPAPGVLADRLTETDLHGTLGARRTHEDAIGRVGVAPFRPPIRLALTLVQEAPIVGQVRRHHAGGGAGLLGGTSRPRKTLGWRTPAEVLDESLAAAA